MRQYVQLLRRWDFRLIAAADGISVLGDQVGWIALLWFVMVTTKQPANMGLFAVALGLPGVLVGTIAGTLLDRFPLKLIVVLANLALGIIFATIPWLFWHHTLSVLALLGLAVAAGCFTPFTTVGWMVALPRIVAAEELGAANSISETIYQSSSLLGPLLAGALITREGAPVAVLVDAVSFWAAGLCMVFLRELKQVSPSSERKAPGGSFWEDTRNGFKYLLASKGLLWLTIGAILLTMLNGSLDVSLPLFVHRQLMAVALILGGLWAVYFATSILGSLVSGLIQWKHEGLVMGCMVVGWGLSLAPLLWFDTIKVAFVSMALAGFLSGGYPPMSRTAVQRLVPFDMQGRILGIRGSVIALGPMAGAALGSVAAQVVRPSSIIGWAGVAMAITGLYVLSVQAFRTL